jgi:hypothetical protein
MLKRNYQIQTNCFRKNFLFGFVLVKQCLQETRANSKNGHSGHHLQKVQIELKQKTSNGMQDKLDN